MRDANHNGLNVIRRLDEERRNMVRCVVRVSGNRLGTMLYYGTLMVEWLLLKRDPVKKKT